METEKTETAEPEQLGQTAEETMAARVAASLPGRLDALEARIAALEGKKAAGKKAKGRS